jgi:hypothetical protein
MELVWKVASSYMALSRFFPVVIPSKLAVRPKVELLAVNRTH